MFPPGIEVAMLEQSLDGFFGTLLNVVAGEAR
jgi:hypothetical protein